MKKTIFVCGGHFTPAKAVVEALLETQNWRIFYLGRKKPLEGDKALSLEYLELSTDSRLTFLELTTGRPQRRFTSHTLPSLLKIPLGLLVSAYYLLRYQPDVILSFGGYLAVPVVSVGWLLGIPIVHHEQVPALDYPSKYLSLLATRVLVSFPHLLNGHDPQKWLFTGNPIRPEVFQANFTPELEKLATLKKKLSLPVVYVTGGSSGAHTINKTIQTSLPKLLDKTLLIWQTGDSHFNDFDRAVETISKLPPNKRSRVIIKKFIHGSEIGAVFKLSDIVIGRSGANTVSELIALGKPAILIPIPWVHDNEQEENAKILSSAGAGHILKEPNLSLNSFLSELTNALTGLEELANAAKKLQRNSPVSATLNIVSVIDSVIANET